MKIIVGKNSGFCYGVKNAVGGTKKVLKESENAYCLGELVHNDEVVKKLEEDGLKVIDKLEEAKNKVIIRAHGIPKETYNKAEELNIKILDYTCPNVLKVHKLAEEYEHDGWYIFLIGIKTHPETIGTISFCGSNSCLIETTEDIDEAIVKFERSNTNKLLIIAQTTFGLEKFNTYVEEIKEKLHDSKNEIQVINTICNVTRARQQEASEISKNVEYMIIIGGRNSSNTKKLFEISKQKCDNCVMIENKSELDFKEIKKFNKIGVIAGASTPQESIDEVIDCLK